MKKYTLFVGSTLLFLCLLYSNASANHTSAEGSFFGTTTAIDNKNESEKSSGNFSVGIGLGIPYGVIGANINYQINDAFDLTLGAGLGFAAGFRYHPLKDTHKFRVTLMYGTNVVIDSRATSDLELFGGINLGVGYGSISDGWDFDLIYMVASSDAKDRAKELELQGYSLSGDPENGIKLSFGYHW